MMNKLGSVIHKKWVIENNKITGYWAEDYSPYTIEAPIQLIPVIVMMQNWLSDKYNLIYKLESEMQDLRRWFK